MGIIKSIKLWWNNYQNEVQKYPVDVFKMTEKISYYMQKSGYSERLDDEYYTCDYETAKKIVDLIPEKAIRKYVANKSDCDKFAWEFRAIAKRMFPSLPIGYCHVKTPQGLHAANFIIYRLPSGNLDFSFIEPQTGKLSMFQWKMYLALV